jgi:hypothetical protein
MGPNKAVLAPIVLHLFATDELIKVKSGRDPTESKPVRFSHCDYIVSSDHRASSRHILNDEIRIDRNVLRHMLGDEPRPHVVDIAGRISGDDPNRLTFKESGLRLYNRDLEKKRETASNSVFMAILPSCAPATG